MKIDWNHSNQIKHLLKLPNLSPSNTTVTAAYRRFQFHPVSPLVDRPTTTTGKRRGLVIAANSVDGSTGRRWLTQPTPIDLDAARLRHRLLPPIACPSPHRVSPQQQQQQLAQLAAWLPYSYTHTSLWCLGAWSSLLERSKLLLRGWPSAAVMTPLLGSLPLHPSSRCVVSWWTTTPHHTFRQSGARIELADGRKRDVDRVCEYWCTVLYPNHMTATPYKGPVNRRCGV